MGGALGMIIGAAVPLIAKKIDKDKSEHKHAPAPAASAGTFGGFAALGAAAKAAVPAAFGRPPVGPSSSARRVVVEEPATVSRTVVQQNAIQQPYRHPVTGQWVEYVPAQPQQVVYTETVQQSSLPVGAIAVAGVGAPVAVYGASREINTAEYAQNEVDIYNQTNVYNVTEYDTNYQASDPDMLKSFVATG